MHNICSTASDANLCVYSVTDVAMSILRSTNLSSKHVDCVLIISAERKLKKSKPVASRSICYLRPNLHNLLLQLWKSIYPGRDAEIANISVYLGEEYVNDPMLSDVTFIVEGKRFYAHRIGLISSSDAFRAMFDGGYKERDAKDVQIPNIRWETFELMMRFIYTGSVEVNMGIAQDLLKAADQYLLDGLKQKRLAVSERLEIDANSRFMVTYNSDNDIVDVCDDLEVNEFIKFVVKSSRIATLCIVDSSVNGRQSSTTGSDQQSNFIHATPSVNVYQTEYHATQIHQTQMPVFPVSGGFYQNLPSYQQMHGFSKNPVYVPGFLRYPIQDPQSDSANRKNKQVVGSPKHKKPSVFGKVKRLSSEDESSESDDESSESDEDEETTPVENKNCKVDKFWNMPPLLKTPVLDIKKKGTCYGTSSRVCLHDTFDSKEQIKIVLGRKALDEGFQIRYPRSDPQRVYAKCIVDTCGWIFRAYIPKIRPSKASISSLSDTASSKHEYDDNNGKISVRFTQFNGIYSNAPSTLSHAPPLHTRILTVSLQDFMAKLRFDVFLGFDPFFFVIVCLNSLQSKMTGGLYENTRRQFSSNEDFTKKISHSVFVTNFPDYVNSRDLWNKCSVYGTVIDVFIPNKKSKAGKRFAFVRFIKVFNLDRLVKIYGTIWIGDLSIWYSVGPTWKFVVSCSCSGLEEDVVLERVISLNCVMGRVKSFDSITKLLSLLVEVNQDFVSDERVVWLDIEGVPLYAMVSANRKREGEFNNSEDEEVAETDFMEKSSQSMEHSVHVDKEISADPFGLNDLLGLKKPVEENLEPSPSLSHPRGLMTRLLGLLADVPEAFGFGLDLVVLGLLKVISDFAKASSGEFSVKDTRLAIDDLVLPSHSEDLIRTFVLHMRPLIIIDGAHLKGEFLGTMYLAVAMDGNNQILPLAYGVGKSETFRSWDWFLRKLKECITGKQDNLTIISDGAVSIASAIKNVFPNAFHGRCCCHLLMNLREKCPRFISKEELFWKACKAYRISDFEERFTTLRNWLPSVANKLDMIGLEK
ncbi:transmembrane 9 superfamily member 11-like protein [Tanacetum coccineum]